MNLLEQVTELRKTVHILFTSLLLKDMDEHPDARDVLKKKKYVGRGTKIPCPLQAHPSPSTDPEVSSGRYDDGSLTPP